MQKIATALPLSLVWRANLRKASAVGEASASNYGFPYTERHLQCTWADDSLRPTGLSTSTGEPLKVINPGRWNLEAGPDFLDATLVVGSDKRTITGDIEIHIHPRDWVSHGHSSDKRYSRVIAHVTYYPSSTATAIPEGAVQVPLKDLLSSNHGFSFENIDVAAYPYAERRRKTPCSAMLSQMTADETESILAAAGQERLRQKAERASALVVQQGFNQALFMELLASLGYKHNTMAFRLLASAVPLQELRGMKTLDTDLATAILLGVSGLLPSEAPSNSDRQTRDYIRGLWNRWWKSREQWESVVLPSGTWHLSGLRPQNHPVRRIAAAASIVLHFDEIAAAIRHDCPDHNWIDRTTSWFQSLDAGPYWPTRLSFSRPPRPTETALIGKGRAASILANVAIPFAAAERPDHDLSGIVSSLPPETQSGTLRAAAHAILGHDYNPALLRNALYQQGLIQIFRDFCILDRTGCSDCRFGSALRSWNG